MEEQTVGPTDYYWSLDQIRTPRLGLLRGVERLVQDLGMAATWAVSGARGIGTVAVSATNLDDLRKRRFEVPGQLDLEFRATRLDPPLTISIRSYGGSYGRASVSASGASSVVDFDRTVREIESLLAEDSITKMKTWPQRHPALWGAIDLSLLLVRFQSATVSAMAFLWLMGAFDMGVPRSAQDVAILSLIGSLATFASTYFVARRGEALYRWSPDAEQQPSFWDESASLATAVRPPAFVSANFWWTMVGIVGSSVVASLIAVVQSTE